MGCALHVQVVHIKVMDSFGRRQGRLFPLVQDSEEYLLFLTNSNPNPNNVIVITKPHVTGLAAPRLPKRPPSRPRWEAGLGRGVSDKKYPVAVVVVVFFVVNFVILVPEVNIGHCPR